MTIRQWQVQPLVDSATFLEAVQDTPVTDANHVFFSDIADLGGLTAR